VQKAWEDLLPLPQQIKLETVSILLIKDYTSWLERMRHTTSLEDNKLYPIHIQAITKALVATNEYQHKLAARIKFLEQSIPTGREQHSRCFFLLLEFSLTILRKKNRQKKKAYKLNSFALKQYYIIAKLSTNFKRCVYFVSLFRLLLTPHNNLEFTRKRGSMSSSV